MSLKKMGLVSLVGRPNVGKSTLLNAFVGQEIAITANKPQTTRNQIKGILTTPKGQVVFVDTPGIHEAQTELHSRIVSYAKQGVGETSVALFLTEPRDDFEGKIFPLDQMVLDHLSKLTIPIILVVNKSDAHDKELVMECMKIYQEAFDFHSCINIAAIRDKGVDKLLEMVFDLMPEGEPVFGPDELTDQPEKQLAAEFIREQIHRRCHQEVPFGVAVVIEAFQEKKEILKIFATILVERESHKGIILGKKGSMIKEIGKNSRMKMEFLFGSKVYLDLHIKVAGQWYNDPARLDELGYGK